MAMPVLDANSLVRARRALRNAGGKQAICGRPGFRSNAPRTLGPGDESVSVSAFEPVSVAHQRKREIADELRRYFAEIDAARQPVSDEEAEEIMTEAMRTTWVMQRTLIDAVPDDISLMLQAAHATNDSPSDIKFILRKPLSR